MEKSTIDDFTLAMELNKHICNDKDEVDSRLFILKPLLMEEQVSFYGSYRAIKKVGANLGLDEDKVDEIVDRWVAENYEFMAKNYDRFVK